MGVLPATQTPPDAMTPEKVITDVSHSAGAVRETGTFPPFKASVFFLHRMIKGILRASIFITSR